MSCGVLIFLQHIQCLYQKPDFIFSGLLRSNTWRLGRDTVIFWVWHVGSARLHSSLISQRRREEKVKFYFRIIAIKLAQDVLELNVALRLLDYFTKNSISYMRSAIGYCF